MARYQKATGQLVDQCQDDVSVGRLPHVSIKPTWTWGDIAAGGRDEWLDNIDRHKLLFVYEERGGVGRAFQRDPVPIGVRRNAETPRGRGETLQRPGGEPVVDPPAPP